MYITSVCTCYYLSVPVCTCTVYIPGRGVIGSLEPLDRPSHMECYRGGDECIHSYERAGGGAPQDSTGKEGHKPYRPVIFGDN